MRQRNVKEKRTVAIEAPLSSPFSIVSSLLSSPASISRANYKSHHIRVPATMADTPASPAGAGGSHESGEHSPRSTFREQDRFLPIANISRIMKKALPANGKIAKDAKETVQECVSEFISFITSEASDKCQREKRKTINGDDLLWAMATLGFEDYIDPLKIYLAAYREGDTKGSAKGGDTSAKRDVYPSSNAQHAHQGSFSQSVNYTNSQECSVLKIKDRHESKFYPIEKVLNRDIVSEEICIRNWFSFGFALNPNTQHVPDPAYDSSHARPRVDVDPPSMFDMRDHAGGALYVPLAMHFMLGE
ncbi:hypothetical protein VNO78_22144 [Psophocarpus tetragonolobus]|uniref:Transcription factor CBF/NF-Y/archaeal histone domain-containing protein n=1 Tax=Psophocarpus tetragonolobus TaxID=3891 RepID=A0AAN9SDA2_PSOTE